MKSLHPVLLLTVFLSLATNAWAQPDALLDDPNANCVCPSRALEARSKSQHVFIGTVSTRNDDPKFDGEKMEAKYEYIFEVEKWFRGELPGPTIIRTFSTTCSTTFDVGKRYAVFTNRNESGQMTASHCSANRIATPEVVSKLEEIFERRAKEEGKKAGSGKSAGSGKATGSGKAAADDKGTGSATEPAAEKKAKSKLPYIIGGAVLALIAIVFVARRKSS